MLRKPELIKNKLLKRFSWSHGHYVAITLHVISVSLLEMYIVLPTIVEQWSLAFVCHLGCASFLLFNVVGNIIFGMFTNTTLKGKNLEGFNKEEWTLCSVCECLRPPRAWHCDTCKICVLKRDHHCRFIACCVGYFNHRYFMFFIFYMSVGMAYCLYINIKYVSLFVTWNRGLILKFICPIAALVFDFGGESLCVFLLMMNLIIGLNIGVLFFYHFNNMLKGRLVPETKSYTKDFIHNKGWKLNVIEVFGSRWYLTWISPLIHSTLPGNGIESL